MSTKAKQPSKNSTGSGSAKAKNDKNIYYIFAAIAVLLIIIIFATSGKKDDKESDADTQTQAVENITPQSPTSSGANNGRKFTVDANQQNGSNGSNVQVNENSELNTYTDPVTGEMFVVTPTGALLVSSIEGQKYIEDFNNLKSQSKTNSGSSQNATSPQIEQLATITNSQIQALDQKLNDAYDNIENLKALNKKQTETISRLSHEIQSIQPVVKSSEELAKDLFGKQSKKVLANKNNSIHVDSIVGNKAWFTDSNGNNVLLTVGDIVPNTSLKVTAIDAATNSVIVKQ